MVVVVVGVDVVTVRPSYPDLQVRDRVRKKFKKIEHRKAKLVMPKKKARKLSVVATAITIFPFHTKFSWHHKVAI